MGRGGKREGAGRPKGTGRFGEPTKPLRVPVSDFDKAKNFIQNRFFKLPLYFCSIAAGAPTDTDDKIERKTDLNELLVKKPEKTFLVKASGLSMINAGILDGDLLVVDNSIEPKHGKIIIAAVNGQLTVKRLHINKNKVRLIAENDTFAPLELSKEMNFKVLGTVIHVIHTLQAMIKCH